MYTYIPVALAVIILSSVMLGLVFYRLKLFNLRIFIAIFASSVIVTVLFPFIYNAVSNINNMLFKGFGIILPFILSLMIHVILIFVLSMIISSLPERKKAPAERQKKHSDPQKAEKTSNICGDGIDEEAAFTAPIISENSIASESNGMIEDEKFVDSQRNIDKMGLEQIEAEEICTGLEIQPVTADLEPVCGVLSESPLSDKLTGKTEEAQEIDAENKEDDKSGQFAASTVTVPDVKINMSLDDYVNEAFRLKENADPEGAILYYMYALDSNPEKDLAFLIVLDICTLYKTLGQIELARDILEAYVNGFGGLMDNSVKAEIERNLQEM